MLLFAVINQHVVFGVCRLIDLVVPDIPESLDVKIKRERYLAKEALQDADHVLQVTQLFYFHSRALSVRETEGPFSNHRLFFLTHLFPFQKLGEEYHSEEHQLVDDDDKVKNEET